MAPCLHEEHQMNQVMREADFWLIATGNACLQISWDKDIRSNRQFIPNEVCLACQAVSAPQDIQAANNACPSCGAQQFQPAQNPDGTPSGTYVSFGKGKTSALSPFEYAFPSNITKWDDLPYLIRLRWRDKNWFEANRPDLLTKIIWEKSPSDRSLQLFKSLALTNDVGTGASNLNFGAAGAATTEGVTEYELWRKPTQEFPKGLLLRVIGDKQPLILQEPEESIPGPLPYTDIQGNPLFPFLHAQYSHMGGRLLGRSALSPLIQKQDQLNQLDSLIQLIVQRMANPVWVIPEGAGIEHFTGEPGLIMKWNPLSAGGQGKPDRIAGAEVPSTLYQLREQLLGDIESLAGTYDLLKGEKPAGVEAFSALQLLVERSQSRFTMVFQSRGEMYRRWANLAIELERQFGPNERTWAIVGPNKGYTFQHFQNAQLQGQITFVVEDGSTMPKTALGKRAAIEQASQLMLLNPADPDQRYALLQNFGLTDLAPSLNFHVQAALNIQDQFERWADAPQGPSPLVIKPWFDAQIHLTERIKWLNTDKMRQLLTQRPEFEVIVTQHLQALQQILAMMAMGVMAPTGPSGGAPHPAGPQGQHGAPGAPGGPPRPPQGAHAPGGGQAMHNSNSQSGAPGGLPKGNATMGPNVGPA
jgi:hypothetical protein